MDIYIHDTCVKHPYLGCGHLQTKNYLHVKFKMYKADQTGNIQKRHTKKNIKKTKKKNMENMGSCYL